MKVHIAIPSVEELYPWSAVVRGVRAMGAITIGNDDPLGADVLVTWSPWHRSRREALVLAYKRLSKPVLVIENGWLSPIQGESFYQLAHDGWNGTGYFPVGPEYRFEMWGRKMEPWRDPAKPGYSLIIGQRGHPWDRRTAPPGWHDTLDLGHPNVVRRPRDCTVPLANHLSGAAEVHVWSSNAASWALIAGVPVVHHGDNLMVSALASRPGQPVVRPNRTPELERLAWAQWSKAELETGLPFKRLLVTA